MKGELFAIGEIARIKGITVKALRFYEKIGLLSPHYIDPGSGYRYYSIGQFLRFDIIKAARAMEMSPKDIKSLLDKKDNEALMDQLRLQESLVAKRIEELQRTRSTIGAARAAIGASIASAAEREVSSKEMPERRIVAKSLAPGASPATMVVGYAALDGVIAKGKLINAYETGILFAGDEVSGYRPSQIFNTVILAGDSDSSPVSSIPAGRFLRVAYSAKDAETQQAKLISYMRRKKLRPALMLQIDLLNALLEPEAGSAELQVLCRRSTRQP